MLDRDAALGQIDDVLARGNRETTRGAQDSLGRARNPGAMPDGTAILGVTAVLTSGVLGPLVLHHTQKDREDRTDRRDVLDQALEAISECHAKEAWVETWLLGDEHVQVPADLDDRVKDLFDSTFALNGLGVRLNIRLGNGPLITAYTKATAALTREAGNLWNLHRGVADEDDVRATIKDLDASFTDAWGDLLNAARRWHEDHSAPAGG